MSYSAISGPDPWLNYFDRVGDNRLTYNNAPRAPLRLKSGERTHVLFAYGQSNMGSYGYGGAYTPASSKVHMFNWHDGGMYQCMEPMPGNDGGHLAPGAFSSPLPRIGDKLIAGGHCDRVILITMAMGGTTTADWATGAHANRLTKVAKRVKAAGLPVTAILRHQGESEVAMGTGRDLMRDRIRAEIGKIRAEGFTAPALVALATYFNGVNVMGSPANTEVRYGQLNAADGISIFTGPDTDDLGAEFRGDAAHMNPAGLNAHADLWIPKIVAHCTPILLP